MSYQLDYKPPATVRRFMLDRSETKVIMGPQGSGKSSGCLIHHVMSAMQQAPDNDGIRRSRFVVVRNTMPMLKTTTIRSFLDWVPPGIFGKWRSTDKEYVLTFNDVHSEIMFMALDDADDVSKLLSLEVTGAYFNEFREIDPDIYEGMTGRIGRYPSKKMGPGASYKYIIADTNPPAVGTWLYNMMEKNIPNDWGVFKQPSGRSLQAENLENLPTGYYNPVGRSDEYVRVMIDGEYGTSKEGQPVFKDTFVRDFHVAKENLTFVRSDSHPLVMGVDAGLTPRAIFGQTTPRGTRHILGEIALDPDDRMGMERFVETRVLPYITTHFGGVKPRVIIDPAAVSREGVSESSPIKVFQQAGFDVKPASSNRIGIRLTAVEKLLATAIDGRAGLLIDPRCTRLIRALAGEYRYATRRGGTLADEPNKADDASHIADAFQYLCLWFLGPAASLSRVFAPTPRPVPRRWAM